MMNWKKPNLYIGEVDNNSKVNIEFKANKDLQIDSVVGDCGCTVPKYKENKRILEVVYKPGSFPVHLKHKDEYITTKYLTVYYKDGSIERLSFKAKRIK